MTLFCRNCGYNLTGLTENRCPECGTAFDPTGQPQPLPGPIGRGQLLVGILWPAILLTIFAVATWASGGRLVLLPFFGALFVLVAGWFNARGMASRLVITRAHRRDNGTSGLEQRGYITLCTVGLYAVQLLLAFATAGACVLLWVLW